MKESLLLVCFSPSLGGLEIDVRGYARWLATQPDVDLSLALLEGSPLHQALSSLDVPIWLSPRGPSKFPLGMSARLAAFARTRGVTRLHVHDQRDLLLGTLLRRRLKVPLAHTRLMGLANPKKDIYHRWLFAAVDQYIAISDWIAADARRWLPLPPERITRIWLGAPTSASGRYPRTNTDFSVGMVARILRDKGQHLLVEAAAQLKAEGRTLRVVLAGQIHQAPYWERLQARAREADVTLEYLGMVTPPDKAYAQLDVAVNASQSEAFGLSTVESMRQGLGVIAADSGAGPEIIRHGVDGFLFKTGDAADLAAQLRKLMDDPALRQRLADSAKARAAQEFDAETQHAQAWRVVRAMSLRR